MENHVDAYGVRPSLRPQISQLYYEVEHSQPDRDHRIDHFCLHTDAELHIVKLKDLEPEQVVYPRRI